MTPEAIRQLQAQLGLPQTGVFDAATNAAMNSAVTQALSKNRDVQTYGGSNTADAILNAYTTGDWSGIVDLSGKPFTDEQQQAAVSEAEKALNPAYAATVAYDRAGTEDELSGDQAAFAQAQAARARQFGKDKDALDEAAADNGVLFSGSRVQKLNDLRTSYAEKEAQDRAATADRLATAGRTYAYNYGTDAANKLKELYALPTASTYNPNVAHGGVTAGSGISTAYSPSEGYAYQGVKPVAQKAAVQTRAAGLLANRANKLALAGYGTKL